MDNRLVAEKISSGYERKIIVNEVDLVIPEGKISVIIGANACGKSTLLKTLCRLIQTKTGQVKLDDKELKEYGTKTLAKRIGLLPQSPFVPEGISVTDLVGRGRFPHQSAMGGWSKKDYEAVNEAMETMNIMDLADRSVDELSGGQRQRVWIAMALAQQTDILFLDEPTTFLDITYQVEILDLLMDLNKKRKTTIIMVLHDINLSARYADYLFAMKEGKLIREGNPKEVITSELIKEVFDLDCDIIQDPISQTPLVVPIGRHHRKSQENSK
ncbi:MAG: ABC transporter ATP-binding protein [Anaerorhabdus sp.]